METLLIEIENSKREFLINLLKEFSFVKSIEMIENDNIEELFKSISESEDDILQGDFISHEELKNKIQAWRK